MQNMVCCLSSSQQYFSYV